MYSRYIFIFSIFLIIIFTGEYFVYLSFHNIGLFKNSYIRNATINLGIILPIIFIGATLYGAKHFSLLNSYLYTISSIWLGLLTYIVITTFFVSILILINNYFGFNIPIKIIYLVLIILSIITIIYGIYNSNNPKVVNYVVSSPKLSPFWKDKKIIFTSDTHLGLIRREKFLKRIVDTINKENPDIIFNLGDLIDGPSFPYQKEFTPMDDLKSKIGNFYVEGNHERYSQEYEKFKENFPKNLSDITNKKVIVNNTQIIGIPYGALKSNDDINNELKLLGYDEKMPSIILMHDPMDTSKLVENNVSLVLSGHTHRGQFFPFTLLVKQIAGKYFYGVTNTKDTISIISSGVGTAMIPIRIGTNPEVVVVTIK